MKNITMAIMAALVLFAGFATGAHATIMDTRKYVNVTQGSSEVSSINAIRTAYGWIMPDGSFLAFTAVPQWNYIQGSGYIQNDMGTLTDFGYGYFNQYNSYPEYVAFQKGETGVTSLGSSVIQEGQVSTQPTNAVKQGTCIQYAS